MEKGPPVPGPPPKDIAQRRRRNAPLANTRKLPAEGREGTPPEWPLKDPSADELAVWADLWKTPHSVEWEKLSWTHPTARYVRCLVASEEPGAKAALLAEVRLLEQTLGLTPMTLLRLRWEIEPTEPAAVAPISERPRRRLNVAEDGDED
jgi:hypothetical protein